MHEHHIHLDNEEIGVAQVTEEGLYYKIQCCCKLHERAVYRLVVLSGDKREDLGILVPEGEYFTLKKKVPRKRLGDGMLRFCVVCQNDSVQHRFIPLSPDEPFLHIKKLKDARLQIKDDRVGVLMPKDQGVLA